mmetsp:Transcript_26702/g.44785  ORF Transcript_26702/g.44785 Transcript_26702/m.44785 type:complete len:80 (+) Transcript_26702:703-942(+)
MVIDCNFAKMLPFATKGMLDCHHDARDADSTPAAQNPAVHNVIGKISSDSAKVAALPATPLPTRTTAAHSGETFTVSSS